ncbi:hypothetical protein J1TS5_12400 [Paenibacillus macerans]|uniref:hypothetical protein n=1 Tax=Paenibacillus macerans TaxID=44252 RepID=UPI001B1A4D82|nr:hypothetical protein [Paenibacillus macerans]GIP09070.1 hypothetical protein J1TS5_12400 [Paenibacillus macerans]
MKKYVAAILAFLFVLAPISVYAAASFTLELSVKEVQRGGEITLPERWRTKRTTSWSKW